MSQSKTKEEMTDRELRIAIGKIETRRWKLKKRSKKLMEELDSR